jgi:hypothetical protein
VNGGELIGGRKNGEEAFRRFGIGGPEIDGPGGSKALAVQSERLRSEATHRPEKSLVPTFVATRSGNTVLLCNPVATLVGTRTKLRMDAVGLQWRQGTPRGIVVPMDRPRPLGSAVEDVLHGTASEPGSMVGVALSAERRRGSCERVAQTGSLERGSAIAGEAVAVKSRGIPE